MKNLFELIVSVTSICFCMSLEAMNQTQSREDYDKIVIKNERLYFGESYYYKKNNLYFAKIFDYEGCVSQSDYEERQTLANWTSEEIKQAKLDFISIFKSNFANSVIANLIKQIKRDPQLRLLSVANRKILVAFNKELYGIISKCTYCKYIYPYLFANEIVGSIAYQSVNTTGKIILFPQILQELRDMGKILDSMQQQ